MSTRLDDKARTSSAVAECWHADVVDVPRSGRRRKTDSPDGQNQFDFVDASSPTRISRRKNRVCEKSNFARRFNVIGSSSPKPKNISLLFFRNLCFSSGIPPLRRGAARDRHERWGGMRWTRRCRAREGIAGRVKARERFTRRRDERHCCGRQKRVVLAPVAGVKSAKVFRQPNRARKTIHSPATVARRIRRRGEHAISC